MVRNIIMHRDIVPRAFTCDYSPVRDFMRSWGKKYSDHGPLKSASPLSGKVLMYSHIGRVFALQTHKDQVYVGQVTSAAAGSAVLAWVGPNSGNWHR